MITSESGRQVYEQMAGKTTFSAREVLVWQLRESGG